MDNSILNYQVGNEIKIAQSISSHLDKVINDDDYRKTIGSPNGIEKEVISTSLTTKIQRLKLDLDTLIEDATKDLQKNLYLQKAILTY